MKAYHYSGGFTELYKPLGLSLPSDDNFNSSLVSLSTRLTNRYLVTRVIECPPDPRLYGSSTAYWYNIAKPFVWHRNEDPDSGGGSSDGEVITQTDQVTVNGVDEEFFRSLFRR